MMFNGREPKHGRQSRSGDTFQHLEPGRRYHVVQSFIDYDGIVHPVGETWTFRGATFLPYEDGLTLLVATPAGAEQRIRLQQRPEAEARVATFIFEYVLPLPQQSDHWPLLITRQSVCLADDIDAPHAGIIDTCPDDDAFVIAQTVLSSGYLPTGWLFGSAWSLRLGPDHVLFGHRRARRFVERIGPVQLTATARDVTRLDINYWAQADVTTIKARIASNSRTG